MVETTVSVPNSLSFLTRPHRHNIGNEVEVPAFGGRSSGVFGLISLHQSHVSSSVASTSKAGIDTPCNGEISKIVGMDQAPLRGFRLRERAAVDPAGVSPFSM